MVWVFLTESGVKKARLERLGGEWRKAHGLIMLERELSPRSTGDADAGSRDRDVSPRINELPRMHKCRVRPAVRTWAGAKEERWFLQ